MRLLRAASPPEPFRGRRSHLPLRSMWAFWAGAYPAPKVSAKTPRKKEDKKAMARRKLTLKEQLKGVKAALRSPHTPPQLKEGLRRRAEVLEKQVANRRPSQ